MADIKGITDSLSTVGKIVIMVLMFIGRIGMLDIFTTDPPIEDIDIVAPTNKWIQIQDKDPDRDVVYPDVLYQETRPWSEL